MNIVEDAALAAVPGGSGLKLAIKLAPFIAIALLIGFVLWQRNTISTQSGKLNVAAQQITDLTAANASAQVTIDSFSKQRIDNDAIAAAVATRLESNRALTEGTRQAIRNASNANPTVRAWADTAVPDSVRRALSPPSR
jgi:LysB family phage lysis regulatory protein